ncbi:MAG TPA: ADOP family duplicated permease, partial [Polyangia bacterium]
YVVVGVLPAGFTLPYGGGSVYLPVVPTGHLLERGSHYLQAVGRLRDGATLAGARAELDTIARTLASTYPDSNKDRGVLVRSWQESITARLRPAILLLFGAVLLVLVIACANVANMLLARAAARHGELALRVALGATRARVVQQLLTECLLLAVLGGVAGLAVALWGVDATRTVLQAGGVFTPALDARALGFAAAVALGSTFAFGLLPALRATRADLAGAVKEGGRSVAGSRSRLRSTLVVLQVALSFALLVGAALLGRSFLRVAAVDPGFDPRGVVTLRMALSDGKEPGPFYARVLDRVATLPEITNAGITDFLPLSQNNINGDFDIEGVQLDDPNRYTEYMVVSPGYFDTMRMHVVRGRGILPGDTATAAKVCVINQAMARRWFGSEDVLGKHMRIGWTDDKSWMTIVGLIADSHRFGLDGQPTPETYLPFAQLPYSRMSLAVRGHGTPADLAALVRREIAGVDPTEATFDVATMSEALDDSLRPRKVLLDFTGVFGAIALALAALGLYGVLAVQVVQRTRELGIRVALGATPGDVRALVVRQALVLATIGAGVGAIAALALSSLLSKLLYGVVATDPPTYVAVAATLVLVAAAAAWLPARRATAIDPMVALRA